MFDTCRRGCRAIRTADDLLQYLRRSCQGPQLVVKLQILWVSMRLHELQDATGIHYPCIFFLYIATCSWSGVIWLTSTICLNFLTSSTDIFLVYEAAILVQRHPETAFGTEAPCPASRHPALFERLVWYFWSRCQTPLGNVTKRKMWCFRSQGQKIHIYGQKIHIHGACTITHLFSTFPCRGLWPFCQSVTRRMPRCKRRQSNMPFKRSLERAGS